MRVPSSPVESRTFCQLLRARAEEHGDRRVCTFLVDGDASESVLTYRELDYRARQIAGWLQAHDSVGKPVLLVYPQSLDFIAAFFGCLYAGAIAVPAYPPRRNRRATRICRMVTDAHVDMALTTSELRGQIEGMLRDDPVLGRPRWQSTDALDPALAESWTAAPIDPQSLAFLQYTSGSIGDPKGVMVTHANLLENQRLICHSFCQDERIVCIGWLPLHHDMGLIGNLLHPLYLGGHFVFMSPVSFLQQPIRWLRAISKYRGTIGGGPNFGYELCVSGTTPQQRDGLDLSSLEVAFTGAERVQDKTLREFETAFAPYGFTRSAFCPCYGLAETTLITSGIVKGEPVVTVRLEPQSLTRGKVVPARQFDAAATAPAPPDAAGKPVDLVSCGIPAPSVDVRIVDPETETECPPDRVGEIWVAGDTVTKGYWGKTELTQETFQATLAHQQHAATPRHYLRTGDLGFLREGHLYIAGRRKDLIIVRGGNHYPSDIEQTASASHDSLMPGSCAAFGVDVDGDERVVVVQEVYRSQLRSINHREVCESIRQAVVEDHLVPLHAILLVRPGTVPKTTSGKIQRREARRMFEAGEFSTVGVWQATDVPADSMPGDSISPRDDPLSQREFIQLDRLTASQQEELTQLQEWILQRLSHHIGLPAHAIDTGQPFARYGMDSLKAVRMTGELEEHLGRSIAPTLLFDYPNVTALTRYLVLHETRTATARILRESSAEPIAVIGVGCRFPKSNSPASFWKLLQEGRDAIGPVPVSRWGESLQHISDRAVRERHPVTCGGFLEHIDLFDANLFGINAREAEEMDPQQRLLLHAAWETFEHAGISIDSLAGSQTGVFLGVSGNEYAHLQSMCRHSPNIYRATGNSLAVIANRVSFLFDFQGPSWTVDTACSSSLVAVHQAVVSLRRGECNLALAGGISLIVSPDTTSSLNQSGMLSATGRCHAFSSDADGFVRGEGCGVVLLKRLSDAQAAGDRILCLVRGSAVNQDGRSNGLTAPNGLAQQAVLRSALADAQLQPGDVDYIEAHGTGTPLGDPIEMGALAGVFAADRAPQQPLSVGSVKTNIGHLEGAAGIAGLIKVCLALQQGALPPHLHFTQPSPHIDWNWPLRIPTTLTPWPAGERPRRAGVSSFGFGGTNAHVIVEEAPQTAAAQPTPEESPASLLVLSAKTPTALTAQARQYAQVVQQLPLADLCYTAAVGRAHFPYRLAVPAEDPRQLYQALQQFGQQEGTPPELQQGQIARECTVACVFGGQGGQVRGAGRALYQQNGTFRTLLEQTLEQASGYWPRDLRPVLWEEPADGQQVDIQPALFCLQVSMARLWQHYGLRPRAVLGHSLGEYAAAWLAGVFSLDAALRLVTTRARLLSGLPTAGAMLVVWAEPQQVRTLLAPWRQVLDVAAHNGPRQTVVAGAAEALAQFRQQLDAQQIRCQPLDTTHAFHSPLVEPLLADFAEVAQQIAYAPPQLPYFSSTLGRRAGDEVAQATYWQQHLRQTVRFHEAAQGLLADKPTVILEVGAGSTLVSLLRSGFRQPDVRLLKGLSGSAGEWPEQLRQLAQLYVLGAPLEWHHVWHASGRVPGHKITLPTYPFEVQRYWFPAAQAATRPTATGTGRPVHPLLGCRLELAGREIVYETHLSADGYLRDHRIGARILLPASGFLELALAAGQDAGFKLLDVCDLKIRRPLELDAAEPSAAVRVQVVLTPRETGFECRLLSWQADHWQPHATCQLTAETTPLSQVPLRNMTAAGTSESSSWSPAEHYAQCRQLGLHYGPAFQGLRSLVPGAGQAWGEVQLPSHVAADGYLLHPALLDACLQVTAGAFPPQQAASWLPVNITRYRFSPGQAGDTDLMVQVTQQNELDDDHQTITVDVVATTRDGRHVASIEGLQLQRARLSSIEDLFYYDRWVARQRCCEHAPVIPNQSAADIAEYLASRRGIIAADTGLAAHTKILDALETLCGELIYWTLHENFRPLQRGMSFSTSEVADSLGIRPEHARLLQRLLSILCEDGYLQDTGTHWTVAKQPSHEHPATVIAKLLHDHPAAEPELALLNRCGGQLLQVMRGETDPLRLLFPSDGSVSAGNLYRDSIGGQALNTLIAEAVAKIAGELPDGRGLRMLEIGAGTGSTTESILKRISDRPVQYVFTDIAASFLSAAKPRFAAWQNVQYRVLDIERDPLAQGFEPSRFDVIVAANVIHATKDMQESLQHIRQLLAPGGKLIVLEGTRPVRWLDLTFGLTGGWWRFSDTQRRPDYPLLSGNDWQSLLADTGFSASRIIAPLAPAAGLREPENSVIVAQIDDTPPDPPTTLPAVRRGQEWLVFADEQGLGEQLAGQLITQGAVCHVVRVSELESARQGSSADELITSSRRDDRIHEFIAAASNFTDIVFLWPLDGGTSAAPDKRTQELNDDLLSIVQGVAESRRQQLRQVGQGTDPLRFWIVTRGAQVSADGNPLTAAQASLWGFARTLALEHQDWQCQLIDVDPQADMQRVAASLYDEVTRSELEREAEIAFRDGERLVRRMQQGRRDEAGVREQESLHLEITCRGTLDGLQCVRRPRVAPAAHEIEVAIRASGLNFRDVLNTLGQYPGTPPLGAEGSGIVTRVGHLVRQLRIGDRVAIVAPDAFGEFLTIDESLAVQIPDAMSLEEAATVPIAFLTAARALEELGQLKAGDRVLIHAATGGVGLAAIQLALDAGAEVFATASTGKHETLKRLGIEHLYDSRRLGFADQILAATSGRGVDLVLNSLGDEFISENVKALAGQGKYLDITKSQLAPGHPDVVSRTDLAYYRIDLADELQRHPQSVQPKLAELFAHQRRAITAIAAEEIRPCRRARSVSLHAIRAARRQDPPLPHRQAGSFRFSPRNGEQRTGAMQPDGSNSRPADHSRRSRLSDRRRVGWAGLGSRTLSGTQGSRLHWTVGATPADSCRTGDHQATRVFWHFRRNPGSGCRGRPSRGRGRGDAARARSVGGSLPLGRSAGRRTRAAAICSAVCQRTGAESSGCLESPLCHAQRRSRSFRAVFVRIVRARFRRSSQPRGRQCLPGRFGSIPAGTGAAGIEHQLGALVRHRCGGPARRRPTE